MARLRILATARADLIDIRLYGNREFGEEISDAYFRGFKAAFALLREHPLAGPARPDLGKGIRCLTHRRHRIFYRVESDLVLIVRIVHHAENAKTALGRMGEVNPPSC